MLACNHKVINLLAKIMAFVKYLNKWPNKIDLFENRMVLGVQDRHHMRKYKPGEERDENNADDIHDKTC